MLRWFICLLVVSAVALAASATPAMADISDHGEAKNGSSVASAGGGAEGPGILPYNELKNTDHNPKWPTTGCNRIKVNGKIVKDTNTNPFDNAECWNDDQGLSDSIANKLPQEYSPYYTRQMGYDSCDTKDFNMTNSLFEKLWYYEEGGVAFWNTHTPSQRADCPLWQSLPKKHTERNFPWQELHYWDPPGTSKRTWKYSPNTTVAWNLKLWYYNPSNPNSSSHNEPFFERRVGLSPGRADYTGKAASGSDQPGDHGDIGQGADNEGHMDRTTATAESKWWWYKGRRWSDSEQQAGPIALYDNAKDSKCQSRYATSVNRSAPSSIIESLPTVMNSSKHSGDRPAISCYWEWNDWDASQGSVYHLPTTGTYKAQHIKRDPEQGAAIGTNKEGQKLQMSVLTIANMSRVRNKTQSFEYWVDAPKGAVVAGLIVGLDQAERITYQTFSVFTPYGPPKDCGTSTCCTAQCEVKPETTIPSLTAKVEMPSVGVTGVQQDTNVKVNLPGGNTWNDLKDGSNQSAWAYLTRTVHYTPQRGYNGAGGPPVAAAQSCYDSGTSSGLYSSANYVSYSSGFRCLRRSAAYGFNFDADQTGYLAAISQVPTTTSGTASSFNSNLGITWLRPTLLNPCADHSPSYNGKLPSGSDDAEGCNGTVDAATAPIDENGNPVIQDNDIRNVYDDFLLGQSFYESRFVRRSARTTAEINADIGRINGERLRCDRGSHQAIDDNDKAMVADLASKAADPNGSLYADPKVQSAADCDQWNTIADYDASDATTGGYFVQRGKNYSTTATAKYHAAYAHPHLSMRNKDTGSEINQTSAVDRAWLTNRNSGETLATRTSPNADPGPNQYGSYEFYACHRGPVIGGQVFHQTSNASTYGATNKAALTEGAPSDGAAYKYTAKSAGDDGCQDSSVKWQWQMAKCYPSTASAAKETGIPQGVKPSTWTTPANGKAFPNTPDGQRFVGSSPRQDSTADCEADVVLTGTLNSHAGEKTWGWNPDSYAWKASTTCVKNPQNIQTDAQKNSVGWTASPTGQLYNVPKCTYTVKSGSKTTTVNSLVKGRWYLDKVKWYWPNSSTVFPQGGVCGPANGGNPIYKFNTAGGTGYGTGTYTANGITVQRGKYTPYIDGNGNVTQGSDMSNLSDKVNGPTATPRACQYKFHYTGYRQAKAPASCGPTGQCGGWIPASARQPGYDDRVNIATDVAKPLPLDQTSTGATIPGAIGRLPAGNYNFFVHFGTGNGAATGNKEFAIEADHYNYAPKDFQWYSIWRTATSDITPISVATPRGTN